MDINKTEVFIDVPENSIDIQVTFRFGEAKEYFIYAILPYEISGATAFAIHNSMRYPNQDSHIGNFSENFLNTNLGSSVVNATIDLNSSFPFHFYGPDLKDKLTLGVSINILDSIVAIYYPLGAKRSVIITFFGDASSIITDEMYAFKKPDGQITIQKPFIVFLRIPPRMYFSESQPSPIEYYIKADSRWIMFSMDFIEGRYAQTLFCSLVNPNVQQWKEIFVFLGGVFVAISGSFLVEIVKNHIERDKVKSSQKKEPGGSEEEREKETRGVADLISIVDKHVKITGYRIMTAYSPFTLIVLMILPVVITIAITLGYMSTAELNMMLVAVVALCIALASLGTALPSIIEGILVEQYYKRIAKKEKIQLSREKLLLKALVKMKIKQYEFSLSELYSLESSRSMFTEKELLKRLWG